MARVPERNSFLRLVGGAASRPPAPGEPGWEDDEALVAAYLRGERDALAELVRRSAPLALAAVRRCARPQDASDLALRAVVRAALVARRVLVGDPQRAFHFRRTVLRIATNGAARYLRLEARLARAPDDLGPPPRRADGGPDDAARVRRARAATCLLPRREREALTLRIDAGLPLAEIADVLEITEEAARRNLDAAARQIRAAASPGEDGAERPCADRAVALSLRAAGALDRAAQARLDGHLAACAGCRAEDDSIGGALASAALAPLTDAERRDAERMPARALAALDRQDHRRSVRTALVVAAVVAALSAALAASLLSRSGALAPEPGTAGDAGGAGTMATFPRR